MPPAVGLYIPEKKQTGGLLEDMKFSEILKKYSKCNFQGLNMEFPRVTKKKSCSISKDLGLGLKIYRILKLKSSNF